MVICKKCGSENFKVIETKKDFDKNVRIRKKLCLECYSIFVTEEKEEYEIKKTAKMG